MPRLLSAHEVVRRLKAVCEEAGGQRAFARRLGVSVPFVNAVLRGRTAPSGVILDALGLERVVLYRERQPPFSRSGSGGRKAARPAEPTGRRNARASADAFLAGIVR